MDLILKEKSYPAGGYDLAYPSFDTINLSSSLISARMSLSSLTSAEKTGKITYSAEPIINREPTRGPTRQSGLYQI